MAKQLLEFRSEEGGSVWAEVEQIDAEVDRAGRVELGKASISFDEAMASIRKIGRGLAAEIGSLQTESLPLSSVEIEFKLSLNGKIGAVIASAESAASFSVKLTWKPTSSTPD